MRAIAAITVLSALPLLSMAADKKPAPDKDGPEKLSWEDRVELTRGLMAEYGTVKVLLPRSRKALEFNSDGTYDKKNLPDELVMTSYFSLCDGKIVSLTVIFNQPSPY